MALGPPSSVQGVQSPHQIQHRAPRQPRQTHTQPLLYVFPHWAPCGPSPDFPCSETSLFSQCSQSRHTAIFWLTFKWAGGQWDSILGDIWLNSSSHRLVWSQMSHCPSLGPYFRFYGKGEKLTVEPLSLGEGKGSPCLVYSELMPGIQIAAATFPKGTGT